MVRLAARSIFGRQSLSAGRHLRKYQMPKCRPTDRHNCPPMVGRQSTGLLDVLFNDCFNWRNRPPTQTKFQLGPTDKKLGLPKKMSISANRQRRINSRLSPELSHFCLKTHWPLVDFGNVTGLKDFTKPVLPGRVTFSSVVYQHYTSTLRSREWKTINTKNNDVQNSQFIKQIIHAFTFNLLFSWKKSSVIIEPWQIQEGKTIMSQTLNLYTKNQNAC